MLCFITGMESGNLSRCDFCLFCKDGKQLFKGIHFRGFLWKAFIARDRVLSGTIGSVYLFEGGDCGGFRAWGVEKSGI